MSRMPSTLATKYVRARVEAQMAYWVKIYRTGAPAFNSTTGVYTAQAVTQVYEGKARIWYAGGGSAIAIGEGDIVTTPTFVSIPFDSSPVPRVDDVIEVMESTDPDLVGRTFRIMSVDSGSYLLPARKMQVVMWSENRTWTSEPQ